LPLTSHRYKIGPVSFKHDVDKDIHRMELWLNRVGGQTPMELVRRVPKPSQLDDWCLYEEYEGEMMKAKYGDTASKEWAGKKAAEIEQRDI
jgi:hypothetical protein